MEKLRVWHMPQVGSGVPMFYIPVESPEEGEKVMNILACYDLYQLENNIKPDFCNVSGLQKYNEEDSEWEDWCLETDDNYYEDVDAYFEDNEVMKKFSKELFSQLHRTNY